MNNHLTQEKKRQLVLERNRLAAHKCREKKKNEQNELIERVKSLTSQNETLQHKVKELTSQTQILRELLLAHDTCQCPGIKSFLQAILSDFKPHFLTETMACFEYETNTHRLKKEASNHS